MINIFSDAKIGKLRRAGSVADLLEASTSFKLAEPIQITDCRNKNLQMLVYRGKTQHAGVTQQDREHLWIEEMGQCYTINCVFE